ncbi:MAG: hypothetical protein GY807_01645, partial [Gammaproteobacteria bacterium]|nr:hypothetical protein [Gammaproteobacteria bacterium]
MEFDTIRYRWELWNISNTPGVQELEAQYGLLNLPDSPDLQAQAARVREGRVSEGVEGGQTVGRGPAVARRFEQATEDLGGRPQQIEADRAEAVSEGRYWDVLANEINSGLIGLEVVARYGSALLDVAADNFHNGDERQIPWREQGVYVIRCTAVVNPEAEEREPTYAPSVATKIVVVAPLEQVSQEAIDAPLDEASQLDVRLALLRRLPEGHPDRSMIRQLEERLETSDILATGTTIDVIERNLALKRQDLAALRGTRLAQIREEHGLSDTAITQLEWEIETLEDQLAQARTRAGEIHSHTRASARRVHGTLVSRATGEIYPLLLQISEPYLEGGNWRCQLSDVTDPHGSIYDGVAPNSHGDVERAKFRAVTEALEDFAGGAGYVEGSLTVRLPEGGWFASLSAAQRNQTLESRPRNEAAAIRRMEELGTAIALLGLVVSSPVLGAVGAGLGAALAAQRFAQRMADGTFSASDPQNIIDLIDILSAAAVGFGAGVRALGPITVVAEGEGFALQLTRGAQRLAEAAETAE